MKSLKSRLEMDNYWPTKILLVLIFVECGLIARTYLDYTVHDTMYQFGLVFSYRWAVPYWISFGLADVFAALVTAIAYYTFRKEELRHKLTATLLFLTIIWQDISGIEDALWFFIGWLHGKPLPALDVEWWWSPFDMLFGVRWTTAHQILYTVAMNAILVSIWYIYWKWLLKESHSF